MVALNLKAEAVTSSSTKWDGYLILKSGNLDLKLKLNFLLPTI